MQVIVELALVIAVIAADQFHLVPLSNTPFLFAIAWLSLRLSRLRWRDAGFVRPPSWPRAIAIGVAAGITMELLAIFVTERLFARLLGRYPDLSDFRPLVGNLKLVLMLVVPMWLLTAFGEEMVYRGWLMNRVAGIGGGTRAAWIVSLVAVSALFGWAHNEGQGLAGALQEGLSGLLLGLLYLGAGRTLAVPIIAHGVSNTLSFALIYLGQYPGVPHS